MTPNLPPADQTSALELALSLLKRASVTPDDAGCLDWISTVLAPFGFVAERFDRNGVSNLWLRRGDQAPVLAFAGHTDVVPTGPLDQWTTPPFQPHIRQGRLYARGAADMKSSIAAFMAAAARFVQQHPAHHGSIALLLTSDEEGPSVDGTTAVVEALRARGDAIDLCIVGEPTCVDTLGDTIKIGRRGSLTGRLRILGKQGHVAYPQLADNPVHRFAPALAELTATEWDHGNQAFPPTSFQISNLHAGTGAGNVIPGQLDVDFNLRFSSESTPEQLCQRIEDILRTHQLRYELHWTIGARPFLCGQGQLLSALQDAIQAECGVQATASTTGGTSDGRFIATLCPQVVEFGPCNHSIHMIDEHILADDVDRLSRVYQGTLNRLLSPTS
jgi:succinyl-diaminopimelate desuccinylase